MARDLALEDKWRKRIEECRQSGLTIKIWCQQNGLKHAAYHYWVRRFKSLDHQETGETAFAEVVLTNGNVNTTERKKLVEAKLSLAFGEYTIGIPDDFTPATLTELVKVLQKI